VRAFSRDFGPGFLSAGCVAFWIGWGRRSQDRLQPSRYACLGISDTWNGVFVPDWLILVGAQPIQNAKASSGSLGSRFHRTEGPNTVAGFSMCEQRRQASMGLTRGRGCRSSGRQARTRSAPACLRRPVSHGSGLAALQRLDGAPRPAIRARFGYPRTCRTCANRRTVHKSLHRPTRRGTTPDPTLISDRRTHPGP
jgi:hypothetical protein